ncbi:hypothetical protein Tcan_10148 [Toxocara canis]|uniref:Uncharacterized protein n=1 Tax=Toxocara canis TaxID=6265 RepID=A0A0B2VBI6_TOXCA|nr:hypothetical protein Tcan_10148 [Toxocara canis]
MTMKKAQILLDPITRVNQRIIFLRPNRLTCSPTDREEQVGTTGQTDRYVHKCANPHIYTHRRDVAIMRFASCNFVKAHKKALFYASGIN